MSKISISDAIIAIRSHKVKDRADGLADLKHILAQNRRSSKLDVLDDKGYHKLFECLFVVAQEEKPKFNKASKIQKAQSKSRLSTCAGVLRTGVEVGVRTLRKKTVKALIDHITQTLPDPTEQYCEPLVDDYLKSLRTILDFPPHPEHLSQGEWQTLVDFCIEALRFYSAQITEASSGGQSLLNGSDQIRGRLSRSATPSTMGSSLGQSRRSDGRKPITGHDRNKVEDLVVCIYSLVSTSNAPILDRAQVVVTSILEFLQVSTAVGSAHLPAIKAVNSILCCCITEDIVLARDIFTDMVPIIRRLWHFKSTLKEDLLITMISSESLLPSQLQEDDTGDCTSDLQGLLDALQIEYGKRLERDQMQVEDLELSNGSNEGSSGAPLSLSAFRLHLRTPRAEQAWALLHVNATILSLLHNKMQGEYHLHDDDSSEAPRKRVKLATPIDDVLQLLESSSTSVVVYALQMLAFVTDKNDFDEKTMGRILDVMTSFISSDNGLVANWSMLVLCSAACKRYLSSPNHKATWARIWQLAARNVTSVSMCQVACHLMTVSLNTGLVDFSDIADFVDTLFSSVDLNGPSVFAESAANLWISLINERAKYNPGLIHDTSERVFRWLLMRWKPSQLGDRSRVLHLSQNCQAPAILNLVCAILGVPDGTCQRYSSIELGPISQAALRLIYSSRLISYLHLATTDDSPSRHIPTVTPPVVDLKLPEAKLHNLTDKFAEYLHAEITSLLADDALSDSSRSQQTNVDVVRIACSTCVVSFGVASSHHLRDSIKLQNLRAATTALRTRIATLIPRQTDPLGAADGLLSSFGSWLELPHIPLQHLNMISRGASEMTLDFGQEFWHQLHSVNDELALKNDIMEVDESFESQSSHVKVENPLAQLPHDWLVASTSYESSRISRRFKICLLSMARKLAGNEGLNSHTLPYDFVGYVTSSEVHEFLLCSPLWRELCDSDIHIDAQCGLNLLRYLGNKILSPYKLERCEVALGMCLDIMTWLVDTWSNNDDGEMSEAGSSLYEWFINLALHHKISSPHVYLRMSELLLRIIKISPEYAQSLDLPSARTSLFQILEQGTVTVKYYVGIKISSIFGLFILREHDAILDDIIASLPMERDWKEGIAIRLFVLAYLGSSWSTLLRRSIYAIFETPAQVPSSEEYARYCMKHISRTLQLKDSQELFKLFVSQIMFTWLHAEALKTLPFRVFDYTSLAHLLNDVQSEVTGQIVMLGKDDEAEQMSRLVTRPFREVLEISFGKAASYCIARDAAIPPSQDSQASGAGVRLRKLIGKEKYASLISHHFPRVLAGLFKSMDREDLVIKGFQKHELFATAQTTYTEIISLGASTMALPVSQQPFFKASALVDEIDYLYTRSVYDIESPWPPALYVYIFRELLDSVHPALGSLHACSVVRKLRVLVCIVGQTALYGYALEMALTSLRSFLVDINCAEDAMGIFKYLIMHGIPYLEQAPSFLAGLAVSVLTSMRAFLNIPQESTTQESQHLRTMSKAAEFHTWLGTFTSDYTSPILSGEDEESLRSILRCARQVRDKGNARRGTPESELLLGLLDDRLSGRNLIDGPSQEQILKLLCVNFEPLPSFRDDVLGRDEEAAKYASVLWETCHNNSFSPEYLLWVARVLGRAYSAKGNVETEMVQETQHRNFGVTDRVATSPSKLASQSTCVLLNKIHKILLTDRREEVGLAERALQGIVSKAVGTGLSDECERSLPQSLLSAMLWKPFHCPSTEYEKVSLLVVEAASMIDPQVSYSSWVRQLSISLIRTAPKDTLLMELVPLLHKIDELPQQLFAFALHLVLLNDAENQSTIRPTMSNAIASWFNEINDMTVPHVRLALQAILYLRSQPMPHESSKADRCRWLDVDYKSAAAAATRCRMFKTALLLLEIGRSEAMKTKTSRRSSGLRFDFPAEILLDIYQNLDDKDSFYGVRQPSSLSTMMEQLEFESAGFKSLSFRGACFDSQIRLLDAAEQVNEEGLISVLDTLDLNGLSQSVLSDMRSVGAVSSNARYRTARKLERWDIPSPPSQLSGASTIFRTFQDIHDANDHAIIKTALNSAFSSTMKLLIGDRPSGDLVRSTLGSLAVLAEMEEVLSSEGVEQLQDVWATQESRTRWMLAESLEYSSTLMSCRETLYSTLSKSKSLQNLLRVSHRSARAIECRVLLSSSALNRCHGALQSALSTATYLSQMVKPCLEIGLKIDAAVHFEGANVLWEQEELSASIRMLQDIQQGTDLRSQDVQIGKSELLAKLGHRISEARLEKPDEIISNYLSPAIKALHGLSEGSEAGQVFHEFASFCDRQLQNADSLEDFRRIQRLRDRKEAEVRELDGMIKAAESQAKEKDNLKSYRTKAKQWFELDNREFQRLQDSRQAFLRQSLENYLLGLKACDDYDGDLLRFSALWMEQSENEIANAAVAKCIGQVASRKFAPLMNQWTSRLLDEPNEFQALLSSLVFRICYDHPFHGMYQIFASSKTKGGKDRAALSRHAAASHIVSLLKANKKAGPIWLAVHNSNINFVRFAAEKPENENYKPGSKVPLTKSPHGKKLETDGLVHQIPPPTARLRLRADCNYSDVPHIAKFQSEFTVASGISAPKILTAIGTDGQKYKQLFKGGNDDLRQDAIMEQVFEQVSNLLKSHRATRQRNLGIRTYKVLPLTATSGIIEFVSNTIPLHDYLMPAHQRYFPNDLKPNVCRKHISDAQNKPVDVRVKTYRSVCDRFHPVLHYFFMERFESPDDWFERRLAYTRSTAAISILGYVLGLGDRHGHNILLDEKTGEVVHIDLGIAFEQGRVLPVPEVVPFRLTRDLVDGMGLTRTEGVFRRCCEFTLEALRNESYTIMTILDVLRYDPLYSWSLSPLRLKKLQDQQEEAEAGAVIARGDGEGAPLKSEKRPNEPGEADRALIVVGKKLGKGLSVSATVNELIQQATDERNLALLFCGWAAYA